MQNFGVTNNEQYGMLWYFLEWSIIQLNIKINDCLSDLISRDQGLTETN